jgi:hypothetical protein
LVLGSFFSEHPNVKDEMKMEMEIGMEIGMRKPDFQF